MTIDKRLVGIDKTNPTYLLVSSQDKPSDVVPLDAGTSVFVGAGVNCKVQLHDDSVQQLHCMFCLGDDNVLRVQDWNTDATYLNGELIAEETVMQSGDMVTVGRYCFTAVLDVEFHSGVALDLLSSAGGFSKPDEATTVVDLPLTEVLGLDKQSQDDQAGQTSAVSELQIDNKSTREAGDEVLQTSEESFKYDIDADSTEEASCSSQTFDSLPTDLGFAFGSDDGTDHKDQTSLLLMEVEQLRFELADRESQISALTDERAASSQTPAADDGDSKKSLTRLEGLSDELETSDSRIQNLEHLLRLSDEAAASEREERAQIEKWVVEIENQIDQRQVESLAEVDSLTKQLKLAQDDLGVLQSQLHSMSIAGGDDVKQNAAVTALSSQVDELRASLQKANDEIRELSERPAETGDEAELREKLRMAQGELASLRLETSRDRAETARRHVELQTMQSEMERQLSRSSCECNSGESRIQAMRDHLREMNQQEQKTKAEQKENGLGGRITNLLSRLR